MTTLDEKIAACEAELSRLRAERDAAEREPLKAWIVVTPRGEAAACYTIEGSAELDVQYRPACRIAPVIELRPGWKLVKDEPAPLVVTDEFMRSFYAYKSVKIMRDLYGDSASVADTKKRIAEGLTRAGIPAVAEGEGS